MVKIGIILGSTRPGRKGEAVARWVYENAKNRTDAEFELVDVQDYHLPLLDEPVPPSLGQYSKPHTKAWAQKVASFDAYIIVTGEYSHGIPAALKNALDFVYAAAGFVSYGSAGGVRAVEHLRQVMAELQVADVRAHVFFSLLSDFENYTVFKPAPGREAVLNTEIDQLIAWGGALKALRGSTNGAAKTLDAAQAARR